MKKVFIIFLMAMCLFGIILTGFVMAIDGFTWYLWGTEIGLFFVLLILQLVFLKADE